MHNNRNKFLQRIAFPLQGGTILARITRDSKDGPINPTMMPMLKFGTNQIRRSIDRLLALFSSWRLFIAAALIIVLRVPFLLEQPRVWAEEGQLYFAGAWNNPGLSSLFATYGMGYSALFVNAVALTAARLVNLEYLPHLLMLASLCVQMVPIYIVCFGSSDLWHDRFTRFVGVAIILFTRISGEVWLNTANSHFHFCLITFLLLLESYSKASSLKRWTTRALLFVASVTGVVSLFLAPLYAYVFFRERERERLIQFGILCLGFCIQMAALLHDGLPKGRFGDLDGYTYPSLMITKYFSMPLFGKQAADAIGEQLSILRARSDWSIMTVAWVSFAAQLAIWYYFAKSCSPTRRVVFIGGLLLLTVLTYLSMYSPKWGVVNGYGPPQRYFYTPNVILMFLVASAIFSRETAGAVGRFRQIISLLLIACCLAGGIADYQTTALAEKNWPRWQDEIKLWRENPGHTLKIWPAGVVQMQLNGISPDDRSMPVKKSH